MLRIAPIGRSSPSASCAATSPVTRVPVVDDLAHDVGERLVDRPDWPQ